MIELEEEVEKIVKTDFGQNNFKNTYKSSLPSSKLPRGIIFFQCHIQINFNYEIKQKILFVMFFNNKI